MDGLTETQRLLNVSMPEGVASMILTSFTGEECLSGLFTYTLKLLSKKKKLEPEQVLFKSCTVSIAQPSSSDSVRYFNGMIKDVSLGKIVNNDYQEVKLTMVPWLWQLTQNRDSRIFNDKSLQDILKIIFKKYQDSQYSLQFLSGGTEKREICVQYQESDLDFINRLLEEEGAYYFFKQSKKENILILSDQKMGYQMLDKTLSLKKTGHSMVTDWTQAYQLTNSQVEETDYNFKTPSQSLLQKSDLNSGKTKDSNSQSYFYYPGKYLTPADGEKTTQLQSALFNQERCSAFAKTLCPVLSAGSVFSFLSQINSSESGDYLVITIRHSANEPYHSASDNSKTGLEYSNHVHCVPSGLLYHPPQITPKPIISGIQSAVVVGPEGEAIYTDEYGRVKVKFYWDRDQEELSDGYWLRVAQGWAGASWGNQFIPRVGHEVFVIYENGDPDRPIVVSSAYNGDNVLPFTLPAQQTVSGFRSQTINGNTTQFNEVSFDDSKNSEKLTIHAQNDLIQSVSHNLSTIVGQDHQSQLQNGDQKISIPSGTATIQAGKSITLQAGSSTIVIDGSGITLTGAMINLNS